MPIWISCKIFFHNICNSSKYLISIAISTVGIIIYFSLLVQISKSKIVDIFLFGWRKENPFTYTPFFTITNEIKSVEFACPLLCCIYRILHKQKY